MDFILGTPLPIEESLTCEFKEIRGTNPVGEIGKDVDSYAVAFLNESGGSIYWGVRDHDRVVLGVPLNEAKRNELRQLVGQKLATIAPPIPPGSYGLPLHPVEIGARASSQHTDLYVVEMQIRVVVPDGLYLTGSGEAYRKLLGGKKKLSGAELLTALLAQLDKKAAAIAKPAEPQDSPLLSLLPSVAHRARQAGSLLKGSRILWVDDNPPSTFYERATLATLGMTVDVATSTAEATYLAMHVPFDAVISDMKRDSDPTAGLTLLDELRMLAINTPVIFYISEIEPRRPKPAESFAITNVTAELFHYLFDVLERRAPRSS